MSLQGLRSSLHTSKVTSPYGCISLLDSTRELLLLTLAATATLLILLQAFGPSTPSQAVAARQSRNSLGSPGVTGLSFAQHGQWLVVQRGGHAVEVEDLPNGGEVSGLEGGRRGIAAVGTSAHSNRLLVASKEDVLTLYEHALPIWSSEQEGLYREGVSQVILSDSGQHGLVVRSDGLLTFWDYTHEVPSSLQVRLPEYTMCASLHGPGDRVAVALNSGIVQVFQLTTGEPLLVTRPTGGQPSSIAFSPDGELLAMGDFDRAVTVFHAMTGQTLRRISDVDLVAVESLAFSNDNQRLAYGGFSKQIGVITLNDPSIPTRFLSGHTGTVTALACDPDSGDLISGSSDGTWRRWPFPAAASLPQEL